MLFAFWIGYSQDTLLISKTDLLLKVIEQNLQIKIEVQSFKAAQADYRQANSVFLPSVSSSYTAISTTNPLMAFGSKLNQGILTPADFGPTLLNNPAKT